MRNASSALTSFLLSKQPCFSADLFTIALMAGGSIYLTSFDQAITANGQTYSNNQMTIERTGWEVKNTTDVPTMTIQIYSSGTDFNGANFKELAHQGALDGGYVTLERAFMPTPGNVALGTVLLFAGRVSTLDISATGVKMTVKGMNVLLEQYMPKNVYSLGCIHSLYDVNCKASRSANTFDASVLSSGGVNSIFVPWETEPANFAEYALGTFTITSGAGEGQIRTVQGTISTGAQLAYPLYTLPAPGDTFTITKGCNKTMATCKNIFNNLQNFRGFPFIPPQETAYT